MLSISLYVAVVSDTSNQVHHSLSDALKLVMSLQQIASHPQLLEPSAVLSPFHMGAVDYHTARLVESVSKCGVSVFNDVNWDMYNCLLMQSCSVVC